MVEIIEENRSPRFSDQLMKGLGNLSQSAATEIPKFFGEQILRQKKSEAYKNLLGEDISAFPEDIQKEIVKNKLQGQAKSAPKIAQLQSGLQTLQRMKEINKSGGLGRGSKIGSQFFNTTAKKYGEYEQLGKSLISLASTIPIRNKAEFETLAEKIYDPTVPDAQREGILDAMEQIIQQGLAEHGTSQQSFRQSPQKKRSLEEIFG